MKNTLVALATVGAVSACSGGGGANGFSAREDAAIALRNQLAEFDISEASAIPTTGDATYEGLIGYEQADFAVIGDLLVGFNFQSNAISGNASNFLDSDGVRYQGSLALSNGNIDRTADPDTDFQFEADLGGDLQAGGQTFTVDSTLVGDFLGPQREGIAGFVFGEIDGPDGTIFVDGEFGGLKQ